MVSLSMLSKRTIPLFRQALLLAMSIHLTQGVLVAQESSAAEQEPETPVKAEQDAIDAESLTIPLVGDRPTKSLVDRLEQLTPLILGLLAGITSASAGYFRSAKKRAQREKRTAEVKLRAITRPVEVPLPDSRNSIMLLGIGGSGKTTLIKKLFATEKANPEIKTQEFEIYKHGIVNAENGNESVCWLFVADYKGQNLGTLVRAFLDQQQIEFSPIRYGYVNSLVLLVDLFPPPSQSGDEVSGATSFDRERVDKNLQLWNEQALDAVFGLLTDALTFVCLFVNKTDLLENQGDASLQGVREAYAGLLAELEHRSPGARVQIVVGSAERGDRLPDLRDRLIRDSVTEAYELK